MTVYKTKGICAREIRVEIDGNTVRSLEIIGGCNGNTKGLSAMLKGCDVKDAITRLEGITCGTKNTSCPDQVAKALRLAQSGNA